MSIKPEIKASWSDQRSKLRKSFPLLTEKDLFFEIGKKDDMLTKLQVKVGKTKEELQQIMDA